jgi:hypothetical protein
MTATIDMQRKLIVVALLVAAAGFISRMISGVTDRTRWLFSEPGAGSSVETFPLDSAARSRDAKNGSSAACDIHANRARRGGMASVVLAQCLNARVQGTLSSGG